MLIKDIVKKDISKGVSVTEINTDKFKMKVVSVYLTLPIEKDKIVSYLLIPRLLTLCCRKYPSIINLNNALAMNYGTSISGGSFLSGDNIVLTFRVSFIGDEYSPNNENISDTAINILLDCLFDPYLENDAFDLSNFESVRRVLSESIASKIDEKAKYAITRLKEIMCEGEPFGISDNYVLNKLNNTSSKEVYSVYKDIFNTAKIDIISVGYRFKSDFYDIFNNGFFTKDDGIKSNTSNLLKEGRATTQSVTEKMSVNQGQLALGFRSVIDRNSDKFFAAKVMCDIFGGGTYSLLFNNVREKQSLCYYCSAGFVASKGILLVSSGVDFNNIDKAKNAIIEQFESIKKGKFSEKLIEDSKLSFENEIISVNDTPDGIGFWHLRRSLETPDCSPEEYIAGIKAVTKEQIVEVANMFTLDTEFKLISEDCNE